MSYIQHIRDAYPHLPQGQQRTHIRQLLEHIEELEAELKETAKNYRELQATTYVTKWILSTDPSYSQDTP